MKVGKYRIRIWKYQTKSVHAGQKIKEYNKILLIYFKDSTVLILNMHACFESRDSLLVKYFLFFFLNITPSNNERSLQEVPF